MTDQPPPKASRRCPSVIRQAALTYAARGLPVIPIRFEENTTTRGHSKWSKVPACDQGSNAGTRSDIVIGAWFRTRDAELAIVTGCRLPDGGHLYVLDLDGPGVRAMIEMRWGKLPDTHAVSTPSGGLHLYFRTRGPMAGGQALGGMRHFDGRGVGGYVAAPPSVTPEGDRYIVIEDRPIAWLPESWGPLRPAVEKEEYEPDGPAEAAIKAEPRHSPALTPVIDLAEARTGLAKSLATHLDQMWRKHERGGGTGTRRQIVLAAGLFAGELGRKGLSEETALTVFRRSKVYAAFKAEKAGSRDRAEKEEHTLLDGMRYALANHSPKAPRVRLRPANVVAQDPGMEDCEITPGEPRSDYSRPQPRALDCPVDSPPCDPAPHLRQVGPVAPPVWARWREVRSASAVGALPDGIVFVRAPSGSGKTAAAIQACLGSSATIVVTHSAAARAAAQHPAGHARDAGRSEVTNYKAARRVGPSGRRKFVDPIIALPINSLARRPVQAGGTLVLDDAVTLLARLRSLDAPDDYIVMLRDHARAAARVLVLDTELDAETATLLRRVLDLEGKDAKWVEVAPASGMEVEVLLEPETEGGAPLSGRCVALRHVLRFLARNEPVLVATNASDSIEPSIEVIRTRFPGARCGAITRYTDPETYAEIIGTSDLVFLSPVVGTGLAIQRPFHVVGMFVPLGDGYTTHAALSLLGRVHEPLSIAVWAHPGGGTDCSAERLTYERACARRDHRLAAGGGLPMPADQQHRQERRYEVGALLDEIDAWARSTANIRVGLQRALSVRGHTVRVVVDDDPRAVEQLRALAGAFVEVRGNLKQRAAERIAAAPQVTGADLHQLECLYPWQTTEEDRDVITRARLVEWYGLDDIDPALVLTDDGGRLRPCLELAVAFLAFMRGDLDVIHGLDLGSLRDDPVTSTELYGCCDLLYLLIFGHSFDPAKPHRDPRTDLLALEWCLRGEEGEAYLRAARERAEAIKTLLRFTVTEGMSPAQVRGEALRRIGMKTAVLARVGNTRRYQINRASPGLDDRLTRAPAQRAQAKAATYRALHAPRLRTVPRDQPLVTVHSRQAASRGPAPPA